MPTLEMPASFGEFCMKLRSVRMNKSTRRALTEAWDTALADLEAMLQHFAQDLAAIQNSADRDQSNLLRCRRVPTPRS